VGREQFWEALKKGEPGIRLIGRFEEEGYSRQFAGVVPRHWLNGTSADTGESWRSALMVTAARLALNDAGITREAFSCYRSGIQVGVSTVDMEIGEREYDAFKQSGMAKPTVIAATIPHAAASEIARELDCSGKVLTYASACTSGLLSIVSAAESILNLESEMVLAGGGDAPLTPFMVTCFGSAGLHPLSTDVFGDNPAAASRPFDGRREGGVLAEGAGFILLESRECANQRNARIYAQLVGWGVANAVSPKSLRGAYVSAMTQALDRAQMTVDQIDCIFAHAPGLKFSDKMEVEAIKSVFGHFAHNIPVNSIKGMIGNPLAASGPLQMIAAVLSIQDKFIPPTINYEYPDPHCDLDCVPNYGRVARVGTVLINSSGVGGCVVSTIIAENRQVV
jgi:3-oxoacyl-[acyl-carrier-protein] synthase II